MLSDALVRALGLTVEGKKKVEKKLLKNVWQPHQEKKYAFRFGPGHDVNDKMKSNEVALFHMAGQHMCLGYGAADFETYGDAYAAACKIGMRWSMSSDDRFDWWFEITDSRLVKLTRGSNDTYEEWNKE